MLWLRVTSLVAVPLLVHELGLALYGVWAITDVVIAGQGLIDVGMLNATVKYVSDADTDDDPGAARRVVRLSLAWYTILNVGVAALLLSLLTHLPGWLEVPHALDSDAQILLGGGVALFAISNYAYVYGHALLGMQDATTLNVVYGISRFPYLALLAATSLSDWGATGVVAATLVMYAIQAVWLAAVVRRRLPRVPIRSPEPVSPRELARFGSRTYVATMADFVVLQAPKLVATRVHGAASAGRYDLASRLPVVASSAGYPLQGPTLAAAARLTRQQRHEDTAALVARVTRYLLVVGAPVFAAIFLAGPEAVRVWVGSAGADLAGPLRWLVPGLFLNTILVGVLTVLTGAGEPGLVARYKLVLLLSTFGLVTGAGFKWGLSGISGGLSVAAVASAVYLGILVFRRLGASTLSEVARASAGPVAALLGASAVTAAVVGGIGLHAAYPWLPTAILVIAYGALLPVTRGITASDLRLIRDSLARSPALATSEQR